MDAQLSSSLRQDVVKRMGFFLNPENLEWFNVEAWRPISSEQAIRVLNTHESYFWCTRWPASENSTIEELDRERVLERILTVDGASSVAILPSDDSFFIVLSKAGFSIAGGNV
ncbi:hypothetical protein [Pseudogulbenkiania sp. MAI-1]|uniref:hypothetical protein n=1 Tax=Pseudogulbenkiania sp. MAI-1 TaxID=990370 RepID=UPI0012EC144E|nr:hypothetical protein [Pseudogulbenkiania sp. MAI-1]